MTDLSREPELDLPRPAGTEQPRKRRTAFAGLSLLQLAALAILLATLAWGMWVTRSLLSPPSQQRIVAVKLSGLVGEYIQAQARSASPPAQVEHEMRAFMASLDGQMAARAAKGETVLVAEAVLTRNVPDITDEVRRAVYASGIAIPRPASPAELQARMGGGSPVPGPAAPQAGPTTASPFGSAPDGPAN